MNSPETYVHYAFDMIIAVKVPQTNLKKSYKPINKKIWNKECLKSANILFVIKGSRLNFSLKSNMK